MALGLTQTQEQKLVQQQRLTQQHMMVVRMLEMPPAEYEQAVQTELNDNPALETGTEDEVADLAPSEEVSAEPADEVSADEEREREDRRDELDAVLERMGGDDEMTASAWAEHSGEGADYEETAYGNRTSFYDLLREQMGELELSDTEREVMEYLIGSLDADGLLRKSTTDLCDELAIYNNVSVSEQEVDEAVKRLQQFDPAGIGARDLRECLLLQVDRRADTPTNRLLREVIDGHFDELMRNHWDRIAQRMKLTDEDVATLREELMKLNPKPGASLSETEGRGMQQITPEFIVDTADDGTVTFTINQGDLPELHVSAAFTNLLEGYRNNRGSMNREAKEALLYAREKVNRARNFLEAMRQRRLTLKRVMGCIIELQTDFFRSGDDADIRPMVLKDVAERTGLAISTVSRVCSTKYCQTRWGLFRLKHFFSEAIRNDEGDTLSTRKVKQRLREMVDGEDKGSPLSDTALADMLRKEGYPVARRTVTKYRELMGIPVARMRKA